MAISAKTTLAALALALAPAVPVQAQAAEISVQPSDTVRTKVATMEWTGGEASPSVFVERRHGLRWVTQARDGAQTVTVTDEGAGDWSARWLATRYTPGGAYRIRVETGDDTLVSDDFDVRPCQCIVPRLLHTRWRHGGFRLRLKADYAPATAGGFLLLPVTVQTGRPLVRVMRDGRRIGSLRLRYRDGAFRGTWPGPRGPKHAVVFELVSLTDAFGNR